MPYTTQDRHNYVTSYATLGFQAGYATALRTIAELTQDAHLNRASSDYTRALADVIEQLANRQERSEQEWTATLTERFTRSPRWKFWATS